MNSSRDATEQAAVALIEVLTGGGAAGQGQRELLRQLRDRIERWVATRPPVAQTWRAILAEPRRGYPQLIDLLAQLVKGDVVGRHLVRNFGDEDHSCAKLRYLDFVVAIEMSGEGVTVRLLATPCGERCSVGIDLSAFQHKAISIVQSYESRMRQSRDTRRQEPAVSLSHSPERLGIDLFKALFVGGIRDAWIASRGLLVGRTDLGLRLRLIFDLKHEALRPLAALPWELLRDPATEQVLCKNVRTPVVRSLEVAVVVIDAPPRSTKILLVHSQPRDQVDLDVPRESRAIEEAWRLVPGLRVESMPADLGSLRAQLRDQSVDVLHFMGHGDFDQSTQEGLLIFEDAAGDSREIPATILVEQLSGVLLSLVVLSSCSSGALRRIAGAGAYSGVAAAFVRAGFPAVVAMQFPISDEAAIAFGRKVYRCLATGSAVETAVTEGRLAISESDPHSLEWATPVLYLARSGTAE